MSRLLPIDLINAEFPKASFGGYRHAEVNDLVDRAARALEELSAENEELRGQVLRIRGELDILRGEERLVKDAILSAQRAGELLRGDAAREADLILEEARQQARAERSQAQHDASSLQEEVDRLLVLRKRLVAEQRALLEKSLRELEDFAPPVPAGVPNQNSTASVPTARPPAASDSQPYQTRLGVTKPMEPIVIEGEDGEKWVT